MALGNFVLLAATIAALLGDLDALHGASKAAISDFPFAAIVRMDNVYKCGGSILDNYHILTAASCILKNSEKVAAQRLSVRVGSGNKYAGGKIINIANYTSHENNDHYQNNIAVLQLAEALVFNEKVSSITFARTIADLAPTGANITVAGWGEQTSGSVAYQLAADTYTLASNDDCKASFFYYNNASICLSHVVKKGMCYDDSGNGAIYNGKLIAVASYVLSTCGSRYPDVYENVYEHSHWIENVLSA